MTFSLQPIVDVDAVYTDPSSPWIKDVYAIVRDVTGEDAVSEPKTAPYFTDASALTSAFGNPPTTILGPGEAAKADHVKHMAVVSLSGQMTACTFVEDLSRQAGQRSKAEVPRHLQKTRTGISSVVAPCHTSSGEKMDMNARHLRLHGTR